MDTDIVKDLNVLVVDLGIFFLGTLACYLEL
jgi:hypothetical protein